MIPNWEILLNDSSERFPKTLFFEPDAAQEFRYGLDAERRYCLFFTFPQRPDDRPAEPVTLDKIMLKEEIVERRACLVLTLLDSVLLSRFSELLTDIVSEVTSSLSDRKETFLRVCNDWFELFNPAPGGLSRQDLQGIFAELSFLRELLSGDITAGEAVAAWKGPFGSSHDFEFSSDYCFEIKSTAGLTSQVHIASEFQLDHAAGQILTLVLKRYSPRSPEGQTVRAIAEEILQQLRKGLSAHVRLFRKALARTGFDIHDPGQYDMHLFEETETMLYDCTAAGFPALRRSDLPAGVRDVSYSLTLQLLDPFLIHQLPERL